MGNCESSSTSQDEQNYSWQRIQDDVIAGDEKKVLGKSGIKSNKGHGRKTAEDGMLSFGSTDETLDTTDNALCTSHHDDCPELDSVDAADLSIDVTQYEFPFENLVFEGGGNKGLAQVGAVKCLEKLGLIQQIKRFAGTSAGALTACIVAMGYCYEDLLKFMSNDMRTLFLDHSCGYCSFLPNLLSNFGWNPGNKFKDFMGNIIRGKSAERNPDMTFYDLYKERGVELCVVVTNLNTLAAEYCHPKTTPNMPIREALRMSMSIPGVFAAPRYKHHGKVDVFVDGGMLCNYPIHSFDGWFLSMRREDAFLLRLTPLSAVHNLLAKENRFGTANHSTLGFLLYNDNEEEIMRTALDKRKGACDPYKPTSETKLWREKQETKKLKQRTEKSHSRIVLAVEALMKTLHKHNIQDQTYVDRRELQAALNDTEEFSPAQAQMLFGRNLDLGSVLDALDKNNDGRIDFAEILQFVEERGGRLKRLFQGFGRREVNTFVEFLHAIKATMLTNMKYVYVKETDIERTVGINTGHIETMDFDLEEDDKEFAVARGYNATMAYLKYSVANEYPGVQRKNKKEHDSSKDLCDTKQ